MMRSLSTTAVLAVTAVLGLLLIAYVFIGSGGQAADRAPHCPSREALAQVKAELFRRAGELRGSTDPAFSDVQNYSVVRVQSRMLRRHYARSNKVSCTGTIVLDLPPGVAAADGRRSLAAPVKYDLEPQSGGPARLSSLNEADAIVVPLANVSPSNGPTNQPAPRVQAAPQLAAPPPEIVRQPPDTRRPEAPRPRAPAAQRPTPPPPPPAPRVSTHPAQAAPKPAPKAPAPKPAPKVPAPKPRAPSERPRAPVAQSRPSFDCRAAHSSGEIAVCANSELANLDRRMSTEFRSAMSVARPGQQAMLRRSGRRFLHYRDSCGSRACIEDAYRGRMREIHDIMTGGW